MPDVNNKEKDCCEKAKEEERIRIWSWILSQIDGKDPKAALLLIQIAEKIKTGKLN